VWNRKKTWMITVLLQAGAMPCPSYRFCGQTVLSLTNHDF